MSGLPLQMPKDPYTPAPTFSDQLEALIDIRIQQAMLGKTNARFNGVPDIELVRELIVRGWAVFRPNINNEPKLG